MYRNVKMLLIALLGLMPILMPIVSNPSALPGMLLHGALGFTILFMGAVGILVWFARHWRFGTSANDADGFLAVAARKSTFFAATFLLTLSGFFVAQYSEYHRTVSLQHYGRRELADVAQIYTDGCGRSGCTTAVKYRYLTEPGRAGSPQSFGYGTLATGSNHHDPRLLAARSSGHVPVIYDTRDPSVSELNFGDEVRRRDAYGRMQAFVRFGVIMSLIAGCFGLIISNARPQNTVAS